MLDESFEDRAVTALSALAHSARLGTIRYLVKRGPKGAPAGDIAKHLGQQPSAVSFHLSTLSDAGLVSTTRQSRSIIYTANFSVLGDLMGYLVQDCCGGDERVARCC